MNVVVTGANGYLGSALCPLLVERGYSVATVTRQPWLLQGAINHPIALNNQAEINRCLQGQEVVIHLAALAHQAGKETAVKEALYWSVNVEQTQILAQAAIASGIKRFIYMSSIKVNGESTTTVPYRFDSPPAPEDLYGRSKWAAEQMLQNLFAGTATELVVIRPPLIWGGAMKGNLALLQKWVRWGIPLPFGAIKNKRDLVSLSNLCDLIELVVQHPKAAGHTLLVSDGITRNTAEIIQLVSLARSPNLLRCPSWIFKTLTNLPAIGNTFRKLTTNLEVDMSPTCGLLGWRPNRK